MSEPTTTMLEFIKGRYPNAEFGEDDDIFEVGYVNSLFAMELVMFIEKSFELSIPNEDLRLDNFRTATRMGDLIDRLSSTPAQAGTSP